MMIKTTDSTDHLVDKVLRNLETSRTASASFSSSSSSGSTEDEGGVHNHNIVDSAVRSFYSTIEIGTDALFKKNGEKEGAVLPGVQDLLAASVDECSVATEEGAVKASSGSESDNNSNRAKKKSEVGPVQHDKTQSSCDGKDGGVLKEEDQTGSSSFMSIFSCCGSAGKDVITIVPKETESRDYDEIENEKLDIKDDLLFLEGNFEKIAVLKWHLAESRKTHRETWFKEDESEDNDAEIKTQRAELELKKALLESMRVMEAMAPSRNRSTTSSGYFSGDDDDTTVDGSLDADADYTVVREEVPSGSHCCIC